jgi:hypothetical protein
MKYGISNTGVLHQSLGPMATACSSGSRGLRNRQYDNKETATNLSKSVCKKCFPCKKGKVTVDKVLEAVWKEFR